MDNIEILMNDYAREFGGSTATVECNIDSSAKGGVGKLLSVTANVKSATVDKNGDTAKVMATLNCKVVFLNKAGEYDSFDYLCDFTQAVNGKDMSCNLQDFNYLWAVSGVADIDSSVVGEMIKIQTVVNLSVFGIFSAKSEVSGEMPEGVICKKSNMTVQSLINTVEQSFELEETFDTGCTVDKILFSDVTAMINNVNTMDGKCLVSGNICGCMCYSSEGIVTSKNFNTPFSEEINCDGMVADDKANFLVKSAECKIVLTGLEGENVILMQVAVKVRIDCFRQIEKEIIADAFLTDYEIETEQEKCCYQVIDKTFNLFDKIVGSAEIADDMVSVSKVISTNLSRNILVNTYYDEGKIIVEGVLAVNVIYLTVENNPQSILIELPYSLQFDEVIDSGAKSLTACSIVDNLYAKVKRDREFEITANMSIVASTSSVVECMALKNVVVTDIQKTSNFSIVIYNCVDGDDWWSVAKAVGASMESIIAQNPDMKDMELAGKKIVYYKQINCWKSVLNWKIEYKIVKNIS